jgi:hypothetical protein
LVLGKTGGVMAAVDMDEGAGEGWGDDADLIFLLMDNLEQRMSCEFESHSWRGVLDTLCEKVCQ